MGKGNKQTTNTNQTQSQSGTSSTVIDPRIQQQGYSNLDFANQVADNYQTPLQQTPQGFSDDTLSAFKLIYNLANGGGANSQANQNAMNYATQAANWQAPQVYAPGYTAQNVATPQGYQAATSAGPERVSNQQVSAQNVSADPITAALAQANLLGPAQTYDASKAQASQVNRGDISNISGPTTDALGSMTQSLMNPYTQNVYDTSLAELDKARQMTQNVNAAQAAQAGAFGSTRQGVMDAETNNDFARQAASLAANLNSQGFTQAQNTAQALQQQQQAAALANQGVDVNVAMANAGYGQQTGLANQAALNQAAQYNTGSQNQFSQLNQAAQNQFGLANQNWQNQIALANQQNNLQSQGMNQSANLQASLANAQNALQASLANQSAGMQNNQFNAGQLNQAGQFNAGQDFQAGLANQAAQNAGGQFNAGQNMQAFLANQSASQAQAQNQLAAAGLFGNLGTNQFSQALTGAQALNQTGNQQQQYGQSVLDTNYQNAMAQANNPLQQLMIKLQALQSTPYGTTTNTSGTMTGSGTSTTKQQPGLLDIIGSLASAAAPFAMMSDIRLKENITPMGGTRKRATINVPGVTDTRDPQVHLGAHLRDPLKAVRRIRPASYNWKGSPHRELGLIAQNVEAAAPEAVKTVGPLGLKAVHVPAMLGLLTGAVNQLDQKISRKKGTYAA